MNTHLIGFLCVVFFRSILFQQENLPIEKITFTTLTRGSHKEVWITKDSITIVKQGRDDQHEIKIKSKIKTEEWNSLLNSIKNITINEIPSYTSPSNKRAYDGAWHSSIIIITKDAKTFGHTFDNEEPNEKLHALMYQIHLLIENAEQK